MSNFVSGLFFCMAVAVLFCSAASAQCIDCSQSVVSFNDPSLLCGQSVVTSVSYSDPGVLCGQTESAQDFNVSCAIQAGTAFVGCRQNGGGVLACGLEGFGAYLSCSGGLRRQVRAARRNTRSVRRRSIRGVRSQSGSCGFGQQSLSPGCF